MRQETVIIEQNVAQNETEALAKAEAAMPWAAKIITVDSGNYDYAFMGFESIADYDLFCEQN